MDCDGERGREQLRQQRQLEQAQRKLQAQEQQRLMLLQVQREEEQQQQQQRLLQQQQQQRQQQQQQQQQQHQRAQLLQQEHQRHLEQRQQQQQQQQQQQRERQRQQQQQQLQQQAMLQQQQQQQPLYQSHAQSSQHHPHYQHHQHHHHRQGYGNRGPGGYGARPRAAPNNGAAVECIPRAALARALSSNTPSEICTAVNTLTLETFDSADELILEEVSGLSDAILDLMDKLNPAVSRVALLASQLRAQKPKGAKPTLALLDAAWAAVSQAGGTNGSWAPVEGLPAAIVGVGAELLIALLNALRNASFVPTNERAIGHSSRAVQHLISLCSSTSNDSAAFAASTDLLGRVSKHLDIWGRRATEIGEGCRWAEDSLSYLAPDRVRMMATESSTVMSGSALEYVASSVLVFPTLANMLEAEEKTRVSGALGIISKLAQVDTNVEAFNRVPERFLERLVELLTVPLQGCDVLVPSEAVTSEDWLEYNGRVMHPVVGGVDVEVRDVSLEVVSLFAGLSDKLRTRLGAVPGCIRSLTRVAISGGAIRGVRAEEQARRVAALTLTALASVESNHPRIQPLHPKLLLAAASDVYAADLLFNGLKTVFPASASASAAAASAAAEVSSGVVEI